MIKLYLVCAFFVLLCSGLAFSESSIEKSKGVELRPVAMKSEIYKGDEVYLFKPGFYFSFNHYSESKNDYGLKFIVFKVDGNDYETIYESSGSYDSYILEPTFFSQDISKKPVVVLAETGAEYSWGARVFILTQELEVQDLGGLDVAVLGEYNDFESVIPYTKIIEKNGIYEFLFTKDVYTNLGSADPKEYSKDKIKYIYDGKSLRLVK